MLSHHNLYFTPPALLREGRGRKKEEKINQNDIWLVSSEVKPSHVENRPGTVFWVQKIGWASSSLSAIIFWKQNKIKNIPIYIWPLRKTLILPPYHISPVCNIRVNCSACGLHSFSMLPNSVGAHAIAQTCSQDTRNASSNSAPFSSPQSLL